MTAYAFIQPLDVLFLRGNRLFGNPGSYGESLMPPWPSAVAGALRSHRLAQDGIELAAFAKGQVRHPELGTPAAPGSFAITDFLVARHVEGQLQTLHTLPADLTVQSTPDGALQVRTQKPIALAPGLASSAPLPQIPVLAEPTRAKAQSDLWITASGWQDYLAGRTPDPTQFIETRQLWRFDPRIGVGLDGERRRAEDGKLFTAQAIAFAPEVGFLAGVTGSSSIAAGIVRFGGDGRGARLTPVTHQPPSADLAVIAANRRARIVLTTPGLFVDGWRLPGVDAAGRFRLGDIGGRLVCASVPRAEVISGWDLAQWQPKSAIRAVPTGSVYWLEDLEATPDTLRKLANAGLWCQAGDNPQRRTEGFNRFTFAAY